jgi:hypothetical protein
VILKRIFQILFSRVLDSSGSGLGPIGAVLQLLTVAVEGLSCVDVFIALFSRLATVIAK